ncbi:hypothetical protein T4C_8468 [Trichinella pseudospiralis]|uniref:Uncharacterized protein n=1 Tax=Trichinella pseudospiralis TaxID=6337 RepID=A0A0V1GHE6_TRIPS|nr:hypothetical protein T4C_8468 [Trichinella pseudospiralis]
MRCPLPREMKKLLIAFLISVVYFFLLVSIIIQRALLFSRRLAVLRYLCTRYFCDQDQTMSSFEKAYAALYKFEITNIIA